MPTDENNGVVSQNQQTNFNQQVDPNVTGTQVTQNVEPPMNNNSGSGDDFDFNFDDSGSNVAKTNDDGTAHIFTNPDGPEVQNVSNQSISEQGRTGMFKTPDEQDGQPQTTISNDEDSFLADIDPNDVQDNNVVVDGQSDLFESNANVSQESLDQNIENMISFDGDSEQKTNVDQESTDSVSADASNNNVENTSETTDATENIEQSSRDSAGDDWLQQEDKQVEEAFGSQDNSQDLNTSSDINMSSENVAENVESMFTDQNANIQQNNATYVPDENEYSQMSDLLNSAGAGQVDLRNMDGQVIDNQVVGSETVGVESGNENSVTGTIIGNTQGVSESETSSMVGNLGEQVNDNIGVTTSESQFIPVVGDNATPTVENTFTPVVEDNATPAVENTFTPVVEDNATPTVENTFTPAVENNVTSTMESNSTPAVENNTVPTVENIGSMNINNVGNTGGASFNMDNVGISGESQNVGFGLGALNASMAEAQAQNGGLNLDSIEQDIQNLSIGSQVLQQEGQTLATEQGQISGQQMKSQMPNEQVMQGNAPVMKRKKQSGFKAIGIFVGAIVVLGGLGLAATKMFPDKFNLNSIFGGDKIVEYIDNSPIIGDLGGSEGENKNNGNGDLEENKSIVGEDSGEENNLGEGDGKLEENENTVGNENGESEGDSQSENSESSSEEGGDDLDPNSLAALLSEESEQEQGSSGTISSEITGEVAEEPTTSNENSEESFDAFAGVNELFDENSENKKKLEEYLSKGELYKDLGDLNGKNMMSKYGEYIMVTAKAQLTKLENGEEIDTNLFAKFDEILEKISSLAN